MSAGRGNEHERLALLEAHRAEVIARLADHRGSAHLALDPAVTLDLDGL